MNNSEYQQIYYWAHMLDESMEDKCLLTEDEEGKNINKAERWIRDNHPEVIGQTINGHSLNSPRDVISHIREEIPSSRLPLAKDSSGKPIIKVRPNGQEIQKGTCRWMLGVCRIYFSELTNDPENAVKNVALLNDILKVISDHHEEDFRDNNLNGLTFKQLENSFKNEISKLKSDEKERVQISAKDLVKNDHYTIVTIDSFEEASQFSKYVSWCVTNENEYFNSYTQNGVRRFYFCTRDDYKTVQKEKEPDYPKDSYGSSMLAILIDDDGSMNSSDGCTCRWNCGGRIYEPEEIQELLGVDFYKTFVPYTGQELMKKYQKFRVKDDEISRALDGIKIRQNYMYFYVVADGNKIRKYKLVADNCIVYHGKFYHAENGQLKEGAPQKVGGNFYCGNCKNLTSLSGAPLEVDGSFSCRDCDNLTSLSGAPGEVGGSFYCRYCKNLTSLSGAPHKVGRDFDCIYCENLTSLSGAPWKVDKTFDCSNCEKLTSLSGAPQKVGEHFNCRYCKNLTSLSGAPREVGGDFDCHMCDNLTSLSGAPQEVGENFNCSDCKNLTSLSGAPHKVGVDFCCGNCEKLTSLSGAPQEVGRDFYCSTCKNLTSLSGVPHKVGRNFYCSGCEKLTSLSGAPQEVGGSFYCSYCENLSSLEGAPIKIGREFICNNTKIPYYQINAYLAFLRNPTPDHIDETGHYKP